jgi:hypothetical protein
VVFEGVRHVHRHLGNFSHGHASESATGLKLIADELFFMCREILGLSFDSVADETAGRKRNPTTALTPAS